MTTTRTARIYGTPADLVARYLPANYEVTGVDDADVLISGQDVAGWTLDGYVLPRLASGNIHGIETVPRPATYIVVDGNCLWTDADAIWWAAPLSAADDEILWDDAAEAEDWSSWADDEADRIRAALILLSTFVKRS